jgi:hypothetical protein
MFVNLIGSICNRCLLIWVKSYQSKKSKLTVAPGLQLHTIQYTITVLYITYIYFTLLSPQICLPGPEFSYCGRVLP